MCVSVSLVGGASFLLSPNVGIDPSVHGDKTANRAEAETAFRKSTRLCFLSIPHCYCYNMLSRAFWLSSFCVCPVLTQ